MDSFLINETRTFLPSSKHNHCLFIESWFTSEVMNLNRYDTFLDETSNPLCCKYVSDGHIWNKKISKIIKIKVFLTNSGRLKDKFVKKLLSVYSTLLLIKIKHLKKPFPEPRKPYAHSSTSSIIETVSWRKITILAAHNRHGFAKEVKPSFKTISP